LSPSVSTACSTAGSTLAMDAFLLALRATGQSSVENR
jgi:ABC-type Fe2+-enterobactin transport system substrate-binding protein